MRLCLDIGHGPGRLGAEWVNLSATKLPDTDEVCVWGADPIPFVENTFDIVHSSHCLEHIPWYQTVDALREARRVLKPGGRMEVWVPDFAYIVKCYHEGCCGDRWRRYNKHGDFMRWVNGRLFAYERGNEQNFHRAVFDRPYLEQCFREAGFTTVTALDEPRSKGHPPQLQLGVGGVK